jgi:hypothetical protein
MAGRSGRFTDRTVLYRLDGLLTRIDHDGIERIQTGDCRPDP